MLDRITYVVSCRAAPLSRTVRFARWKDGMSRPIAQPKTSRMSIAGSQSTRSSDGCGAGAPGVHDDRGGDEPSGRGSERHVARARSWKRERRRVRLSCSSRGRLDAFRTPLRRTRIPASRSISGSTARGIGSLVAMTQACRMGRRVCTRRWCCRERLTATRRRGPATARATASDDNAPHPRNSNPRRSSSAAT